jgi:hypothetical protein
MVNQFLEPRAEECVDRLERIPLDAPCRDRADYRFIGVPTLLLGNQQDPIHPWSFAVTIAEIIPGALLRELTPKSVSLERHAADVQKEIDEFMLRIFRAYGHERTAGQTWCSREKVAPC